jgi:hypothetical protein
MKATLALLALIASFSDWIWGLWHGPVHLSCQGNYTTYYQGDQHTEARTLHVEINFTKETVTVENFVAEFKIDSTGNDGIKFVDSTGRGLAQRR